MSDAPLLRPVQCNAALVDVQTVRGYARSFVWATKETVKRFPPARPSILCHSRILLLPKSNSQAQKMTAYKPSHTLSALLRPVSVAVLLLFFLLDAQPARAIWPHPTWLSEGTISRSLEPATLKLTANVALPADVHRAFARTVDNIARYGLPGHMKRQSSTGKGPRILEVHVEIAPWEHDRENGMRKRLGKQSYMGKGTQTGIPSIAGESIRKLEHLEEKYVLTVPQEGRIRIRAASALGVFRGFTTVEHLVYSVDGDGLVIPNTPIKVSVRVSLMHCTCA